MPRLSAVEELRPGLWFWKAAHPEWTPKDGGPTGWEQEVSSYAWDAGSTLVLFDPQSPPQLVDELASGKQVAVVLTCGWHARSAEELRERLGASVWSPGSDGGRAARRGRGLRGRRGRGGRLWIAEHGALVIGDALIVARSGWRCRPRGCPKGMTVAECAAAARAAARAPGRAGARRRTVSPCARTAPRSCAARSYNRPREDDGRDSRRVPALLRVEGPPAPAVGAAAPAARRPDDAADQRGHAAAEAVLPRARSEPPGDAADDLPEVLPRRPTSRRSASTATTSRSSR